MEAASASPKADEAVDQKKKEGLPAPQMREAADVRRLADGEQKSAGDAVKAVADDETLTDEERADALAWFLSDDPDDWGAETDTIEINVGTKQHPKWIEWVIRPVDDAVLREIQKAGQGRRGRSTRPQQEDLREELINNARVIVKGTAHPDLEAVAREKGIADPALLVRQRFASKPGLIAQISGEIMGLSGFDVDDVREVTAAGN